MKQTDAPGCLLTPGDTIKLGRIKFTVKEVKGEHTVESLPENDPVEDLVLPE